MKNLIKKSNKYLTLGILFLVLFSNTTSAQTTPTVTVTANPTSVGYLGTSVINWSSTGANYCYAQGVDAGNDATGSFTTPPLPYATTYNVSCSSAYACFSDYTPRFDGECAAQTSYDSCITETRKLTPSSEPIPVCSWGPTPSTVTKTSSVTVNVSGSGNGNTNNTTIGPITDVFTEDANEITETGAKLWGKMNPGGSGDGAHSADVYFRYSAVSPEAVTPIFCNDIYGSNMRATNEYVDQYGRGIWGDTPIRVQISVGGLEPDTTYYYCIVGSNATQIAYGGVKSFTTRGMSITTKTATVVDSSSAYLKGFFNTNTPAHTWFEYRKKTPWAGDQNVTPGNTTGVSFFKKLFENFFQAEQAVAADNYGWSIKKGERAHGKNTNGVLDFLLTGLSPSTVYEFRAVIKDDSSPFTKYGVISSFITRSSGGTGGNGGGGGEPYKDPCANTATDINCNGTGGSGHDPLPGLTNLPDLIADQITFSPVLVNTPAILYAVIRNQGDASTVSPDIQSKGANVSNNFYNFFQITTQDPTSNNFDAQSLALTSSAGTSNSFYPPISTPPLGARSSTTITQTFTFHSNGKYYVRACADKSSPADKGLIKESYENNNCGHWTTLVVGDPSLICTDPTASNYGDVLPCRTLIGPPVQACVDTTALNYGFPLPCIFNSNLCMNYTATNYGSNLPCTFDNGGNGGGGGGGGNGGGSGNSNGNGTNYGNLVLGQKATPPIDAIVRYHEGIETVFARQIIANLELAESYGYKQGDNLQSFAWNLADLLGRTFGYVNSNGKEIRVSKPDIAAYQLYMKDGILTVYEYYNEKIVNIQKMTGALRSKYEYEYYFNK